jgi:hypothetical protein
MTGGLNLSTQYITFVENQKEPREEFVGTSAGVYRVAGGRLARLALNSVVLKFWI